MNEPRDIQTIFNVAIESGHYNEHGTDWMCGALKQCTREGFITHLEYDIACEDIYKYLDTTDCAFLETALRESRLPSKFKDRLAIYKDWANKPELKPFWIS